MKAIILVVLLAVSATFGAAVEKKVRKDEEEGIYEKILREFIELMVEVFPDPFPVPALSIDFSGIGVDLVADFSSSRYGYISGQRTIAIRNITVNDATGEFSVKLSTPYLAIIGHDSEIYSNTPLIYPQTVIGTGHYNIISNGLDIEIVGQLRLLPSGVDDLDYWYTFKNSTLIMDHIQPEAFRTHWNIHGPQILSNLDVLYHAETAAFFEYILDLIMSGGAKNVENVKSQVNSWFMHKFQKSGI